MNIAAVFLILLPNAVCAKGGSNAPQEICASGSKWYDANIASFEMRYPGTKDSSRYKFEIASNKDMLLTTSFTVEGKKTEGRILLLSGMAMLTKGFELKKGYEIDYIDGPALMYQLVISLLNQAFPLGPYKTDTTKKITKVDTKRGIKVATMSAGGLFGPSWKLKADISKIKPNYFSYDLFFTFDFPETESGKMSYEISGTWEKTSPSPSFPDEMQVNDWGIYWIGPIKKELQKNTIFDYGATPGEKKAQTVGDFRRIIKESK